MVEVVTVDTDPNASSAEQLVAWADAAGMTLTLTGNGDEVTWTYPVFDQFVQAMNKNLDEVVRVLKDRQPQGRLSELTVTKAEPAESAEPIDVMGPAPGYPMYFGHPMGDQDDRKRVEESVFNLAMGLGLGVDDRVRLDAAMIYLGRKSF